MKQLEKLINKLALTVIGLTVLAVPLFFLPITSNFYDWNKQVLLLGMALILLVLWVSREAIKGEWLVRRPPLMRLLLAFFAVMLASTFANPDYMSALMGSLMFFGALLIFYFGIVQFIDTSEKAQKAIIWPLILTAMVLALLSIAQYVGLLPKLLTAPWLNESWTPAGSQFPQIVVLVTTLALIVEKVIREFSRTEGGHEVRTGLLVSLSLIVAFAIIIAVLGLYPKANASNLSFLRLPAASGWRIATGVLGANLRETFIGVGPENFASAFNRFKPQSLNLTPLGNIIFFKSTNEPFHIIATLGILGFLLWTVLALSILKGTATTLIPKLLAGTHDAGRHLEGGQLALTMVILLQIIAPPTNLGWLVLLLLMAAAQTETKTYENRALSAFLPTIVLAAIVGSGYTVARAYRGEMDFYAASRALEQNRPMDTYNLQLEALNANPKNFNYHQGFSVTNMLLADAMLKDANQKTEPETDPSDEVKQLRQQASTLIQQSINEAQTAVTLAPNRSETWQTLGSVYQALIGMLDGAPGSAINAYQNAVNLAPTDPSLRLALGAIILGQGDPTEAIFQLRLAVQARPDLPNTWYNLAAAYLQAKDLPKARSSLQQTLDLLPSDAADRSRVQQEFDALTKQLEEATRSAQPQSELPPAQDNQASFPNDETP